MNELVQEKLYNFFKDFERINLKDKELLVRPNEIVKYIYFLEKGEIKQYVNTLRGEEIIFNIFSPGSYIPMMLIVSDTPNTYYFETINEAVVYKAPISKVLSFVKSDIDICFDLAARFAGGLSNLLTNLENTLYQDSYHKVLTLLIYLAKKFGKIVNNKTLIDIPLSHYDIASFTGLQRETASRQLEKLINKEIISNHSKFFIVDLEKLSTEERQYKYYLAKK